MPRPLSDQAREALPKPEQHSNAPARNGPRTPKPPVYDTKPGKETMRAMRARHGFTQPTDTPEPDDWADF